MKGFFFRPLLVAKVVVRNDQGQVLLIRRSITAPPKVALTWDLPGGIVDPGESPAAAAVRETREETGLNISDVQLLSVEAEPKPAHIVVVFYGAKVSSNNVTLSHEHDQHQWLKSKQIDGIKINPLYKQAAQIG